jgi:hypothetical protein
MCSQVPIFYGTGEDDVYAPAFLVQEMYQQTPSTKTFADMARADHYEPGKKGHDRWTDYVASFFGCHLSYSDSACGEIYNFGKYLVSDGGEDESCNLCECERVPMTKCESDMNIILNE